MVGLGLGALCVTPFVLTYLFVIRWVDRFRPEPWWLITLAFGWGAIFATLGGGYSSVFAQKITSVIFHVSPAVMDKLGTVMFAPIFEELFKGIGVALIATISALGLRRLDGPLDGAIYGGVVGLGFTLTEDILYVSNSYSEHGFGGFVYLLFLRTVLLGLAHCTYTACTGLGFGIAMESRSWLVKLAAPVVGYGSGVALHALHNFLPTFLGQDGAALTLIKAWAIDIAFFALLATLVTRDRRIVIRELLGEVGHLVHAKELKLVSSYFALSMRNWQLQLLKGGAVLAGHRRKQIALVELAFIKSRRRRGERGVALDRKEAELRQDIRTANQRGVWIGA